MSVEEYTPKIGKDLLDSLILKLYSESLSIYREYIQNACDSIYEAVKCGILDSVDKGSVAISIDSYANRIVIRDNGTGISKDNAVSTLMDIYHGSKDGVSSAGQYGIGRLSGGGYCKRLIFATSMVNETIETCVIVDVEHLRNILKNNSDDRSAEEIMQEICSVEIATTDIMSHYMEVTLEGVCHSVDKLLNEEVVKKYIQTVAPIDYSVTFKSLMRISDAEKFNDKINKIRHIHVSINNLTDIQKEYGYKIEGTGDDIESLRFFVLEHKSFGNIAWGWFAITPFSIAIPDTDCMRGLQLRKHNIALDRSFVDKLFSETRGNSYFYGEIFIDNDAIVPNSNRDGLAPSAEADALADSLREYFKLLKRVYTLASQIKGKLNTIKVALDNYYKLLSKDELQQKTALEELRRCNLDFLSKTDHKIPELNDVGNVYLKKYKEKEYKDGKTFEECVNEILKANTVGNDTIDKNIIDNNHSKPKSEIDDTAVDKRPTIDIKPNETDFSDTSSEVSQNDIQRRRNTDVPSEVIPILKDPVVKDVYQELECFGYSNEDIKAIRKAYGFIMMSCPKHLKEELKEIINKAIGLLKDN